MVHSKQDKNRHLKNGNDYLEEVLSTNFGHPVLVVFDSDSVSPSLSVRFLGVTVDHQLAWDAHCTCYIYCSPLQHVTCRSR